MTPPRPLADLARAFRSEGNGVELYLRDLEELFARIEPELQAFVPEEGRFDRLRREAGELRERFSSPAGRPPLFGVPVAVKDIFHVEGFETRAGSQVPAAELAGPEAVSVTLLKRAGALVLGKAVTTEFAYFGPGPTRNPHDPERTPGGSSSGSAAAVGAGLAPLALGTQTIGSISRPASFCGVTGYKPSYDRISRAGVIPLSPSLDHIGSFTVDAAGAALAAAVLCEGWRRIEPPERLRAPTLGLPAGPYLERAEEAGRRHFETVARNLEGRGFEIVPVPVMEDFAEIERRHETLVAAEAARAHAPWYGAWRDTYNPKTRLLIDRGLETGEAEVAAALAGRAALRQELTAAMAEAGVDLWISPAAPGPAPRGLDSTGDPVMNLPWSHAGLPTLALPAGRVDGLPMGLQLAAGWHLDEELLAWGQSIERALEAIEVTL